MNAGDLFLRLLGLAAICLSLAVFDPGSSSIFQRLLLPLIMAAGALALARNLAAVAFGTTVLALIHSHPGADDPVAGIAYPAIAAAGLLVLGWIVGKRFRARIAATRAARWAPRDATRNEH